MSIYPSAIDGYAQLPLFIDDVTEVNASGVNALRDAILNIEEELGVSPSGTYATVVDRLEQIELDLALGGGGGGGTLVHSLLTDLSWLVSGHTGTANTIAAFDALGDATEIGTTSTPSANKIPQSDSSGTLDSWVTYHPLSATDVAIIDGGTGASSAADARVNLGVDIGTDVQAWSAGLDSIAAISGNGIIAKTGTNTFLSRTITGTANRISVANGNGVSGQPTIDLGKDALTYSIVADITARNAIPSADRTDGMLAYVQSNQTLYILSGGITDSDWTTLEVGRPLLNRPTSLSNIYIDAAGSDIDGDGSISSPYLTIERALRDIGFLNTSTKTINLGAGSFNLPATLYGANWITFNGTISTSLTGSIDTVVNYTVGGDGLVLDVSGFGTVSANDLRGRLIQFTTGSATGRYGWIYKNDATSAGITRIYTTQDLDTGLTTPATTDTVLLLSLDSKLVLSTSHILSASSQLNFQNVEFNDGAAGTRILYILSSDKVQFTRCHFNNIKRLQPGQSGACFLLNSYMQTKGDSTAGLLYVPRGGILQINSGTVIDGSKATAGSTDFVRTDASSVIFWRGRAVFANLDAIEFAGTSTAPIAAITAYDVWYFDNCTNALNVNINNKAYGDWGSYYIPNLHGTISGNWAVKAENICYVKIGSTSSLTTALGINYVSANNGAYAVAQWDQVTIVGGYPSPNHYVAVSESSSAGPITALATDTVIKVTTAGSTDVVVSLFKIADSPNRQIIIKNGRTSGNVIVTPDPGETINGALTFSLKPLDSIILYSPAPTSSEWIVGGVSILDVDQYEISWIPTNYTRTTAPTEVSSVTDLTAHLAGIDAEIATLYSTISSASVGLHASSHIFGGSDVIDADRLEISWIPSNYTRTTSPTEVSDVSELTAHLAGIDNEISTINSSISGKASTSHASTHTTGGTDIIDGDTIQISWTPTKYTRSITPTEVSSADELTAHLAGIDDYLSALNLSLQNGYDNGSTIITDAVGGNLTISGTSGLSVTATNGLDVSTKSNFTGSQFDVTIDNANVNISTTTAGNVSIQSATNILLNDLVVDSSGILYPFVSGLSIGKESAGFDYMFVRSQSTAPTISSLVAGALWANSISTNELSYTTSAGTTYEIAYYANDLKALEDLSSTGIVARTNINTFELRTITGTTNEIDVASGAGISGNPIIGISDNPIIPGVQKITIPSGSTANRPGTPATADVRFNTSLGNPEYYNGSTWVNISNENQRYHILQLGVSANDIITTGAKTRKVSGISGTIVGWNIVTDQSTTLTLDIWKDNAAIPTNLNSITASDKPTILSAAEYAASSSLTGWTTSVAVNDVFVLEVESNAAANYILLQLIIRRD